MFVESVSVDREVDDFPIVRSPSVPSWPEVCAILFNDADSRSGLPDRHDASGWAFLISAFVQLKS